eukprot:comp22518_c1_seq1/m.34126 comp22518_c1_seq1/g.34126  ORF comp22518_c1_seq1/g.34126 comp22518_c1_seq1/m.34126 type:complete len:626 (-) comp22518_c1_seq1:713-2590(-)
MAQPNFRQLVERATSQYLKNEDWEYIMEVCDAVNASRDGPMEVSRLLIERLQSEGEKVQLYCLTLLNTCVNNCGKRFHNVISRYEFLNELIKLVSKKYYSYTTEPVKRRILGLIQQWKNEINHPKIEKAYEMLKEKGHEFPLDNYDSVAVVQDKSFLRVEEKRRGSFDEAEQNRILGELLKSKDPKDLEAANQLIKQMVKVDDFQEDSTDEKIRRDLDIAENNIKLFHEMLDNWSPEDGPITKNELIQELHEALLKMKPRLARLCGDLEEDEDVNNALPVNASLRSALRKYDSLAAGGRSMAERDDRGGRGGRREATPPPPEEDSLLLDLGFGPPPSASSGPSATASTPGHSILDDDLLSLGLGPSQPQPMGGFGAAPMGGMGAPNPMGSMGGFAGGNMGGFTPNMGAPPAFAAQQPFMGQPRPPVQQQKPQQAAPPKPFSDLDALASLNLGNPVASASPKAGPSSPATKHMSPMAVLSSPTPAAPGSPNMGSLTMKPESFQPSSHPPIVALDQDNVRVLMFVAANPPRPDVMAVNVSFLNQNTAPLTNIEFLAAVPKTMSIKLQPPSSTTVAAFNIMTGPAMASQIMLVSNPTKAPVKIRFKFTYTINGTQVVRQGDAASFPNM